MLVTSHNFTTSKLAIMDVKGERNSLLKFSFFMWCVGSNICNVFAAVWRPVPLATLPLDASAVWGPSFLSFWIKVGQNFPCCFCFEQILFDWWPAARKLILLAVAESPVHVVVSTPCVSMSPQWMSTPCVSVSRVASVSCHVHIVCIYEQSHQWMLWCPHVAMSTPCLCVSGIASACCGVHTMCICEHQFVTKVSPLSFSISAKWDKSVIFVWRSSQQIHTVQYCRLLDITRDISVISNIVHHVITRGGILDLLGGKLGQKLL